MQPNSQRKKVIIIGAGIAGCSTAYALAKRDIDVTLIERNLTIAQAASGNPVAMLYPKYNTGNDPLNLLSIRGFEHTLKLLADAKDDYASYQLCGLIQFAFNQREQDRLAQISTGENLQIIDKAQASEIAGIPVEFGGLFLPNAGWINPVRLCEYLTQSSRINKVMSHEALTIKQSFQHWQVAMHKKVYLEADAVVICNANDVANFHQTQDISVTPVRGQVNFLQSNDVSEQIQSILCSDHYLSPAISNQHSVGTSYGPNDPNPALSGDDTQRNLASIDTISPWLYEKLDLNNVAGRVAWRSATKDYFPLAGALINHQTIKQSPPRYNDDPETLPWLKGLYLNAGHGSKGMITAPLCGELVAAMINQEALPISAKMVAQLSPSRFTLKALGLKKLAQNLYSN